MVPRASLPKFRLKMMFLAIAGACAGVSATSPALAFQIDSGNPDLRMSWDNTVKYSAAWRVGDIKSRVADNSIGVQANTNDGDQNFDKGLISNRLDLLSEFDLRYKRKYGLRLSGAAWYDDVYNKSNDNPGAFGGALVNSRSVDYDEFTDDTEKLHGRKAELLDAFVYGRFDVADKPATVRLGRQYTPMDDIASIIGTKVYDVVSVVPIIGNGDYNRVDNAITYLSPAVGNTTFQVQYSLGEERSSADASPDFGKQFSLHALHASGPLTAGIGLMRVSDADGAVAGKQGKDAVLLVGAYDFGPMKLSAYYDQEDKGTEKMKVMGLAAAFKVGDQTTLSVGVAQAKDVTGVASALNDDARIFTLQANHNLSKRTALYAHLTAVSNDDDAALGFNSPTPGGSSNGIQFGIRHRF